MSLPIVTEEISHAVVDEWREIPDEIGVIGYAVEITEGMRQTNPVVARFFDNLLENRPNKDWDLHPLRVVYACRVYRMLELAGAMVTVSHETAAPVQTEFLRDASTYGQAIIDKLMGENPEVLNAGRPLVEEFEKAGDIRSSSLVLTFGLLLYKIIESQNEANELAESLESFGSEN